MAFFTRHAYEAVQNPVLLENGHVLWSNGTKSHSVDKAKEYSRLSTYSVVLLFGPNMRHFTKKHSTAATFWG